MLRALITELARCGRRFVATTEAIFRARSSPEVTKTASGRPELSCSCSRKTFYNVSLLHSIELPRIESKSGIINRRSMVEC